MEFPDGSGFWSARGWLADLAAAARLLTRLPIAEVGAPSDLRWTSDARELLEDLSIAEDAVPYILEGEVTGADARPPELVVAVNGTLAGTLGGYLPDGDAWRFTGYVGPLFQDGRNRVEAYEVERTGGEVTLHALAG